MKHLFLCCALLISTSCFTQEDEIWICMCDSPLEFPGGQNAFERYIREHIHITPEMSNYLAPSSRMYVSFTGTKMGTIKDVSIARGICRELDRQVLCAFRSMPQWKPAESGCGNFYALGHRVPIRICVK